jgi:hypothetical protein
MTPKVTGLRFSGFSYANLKASWYVSRTPTATLRFYWRGLWRALHPIPADRPLPRPTHDF